MNSADPTAQPGRWRSAGYWPVGLVIALIAGLNVALPGAIEWYARSGGRDWEFAGFAAAGIVAGEIALVLLLAGLGGRTALGGFLLGLATACLFCGAFMAGFWLPENFSPPDLWTPFCLLPALLICGAAPLLALRLWFGWRLSRNSSQAPRPAPLLLEDLFAAAAVVAAAISAARIPLVVDEIPSAGEFWAAVAIVCGVALGIGLLIVPLCAKLTLGVQRRWLGWLGLALFAAIATAILFLIAHVVLSLMGSSWGRLQQFVLILTLTCAAFGLFYLFLATLAFSGLTLARRGKKGGETDVAPVALDAKQIARQRRSARIAIALALLAATCASITMARLQAWRAERDAEMDRLVRIANRMEGSIFHSERKEEYLKLGPPAKDDDLLLFRDCRQLQSLELDMPHLTDAGLAHLELFPQVTWLHLNAPRMTDKGMQHIGRLHGLTDLEIRGAPITDEGLRPLADLSQLFYLRLIETNVRGAGLTHLPRENTINSLTLDGSPIDDSACEVIAQWSQLAELLLRDTQISDQGLRQLAAAPSLATLDLRETNINGSGLRGFKELRNLYLDNSSVTDDGLAGLKDSHQLYALSLKHTGVGDAGLKHVAAIANLNTVRLNDTSVTDQGVAEFRNHDNLNYLDLSGTSVTGAAFQNWTTTSSLTTLVLVESAIDDAGVAQLAMLPNLIGLWLGGTNVSDACLPHLAKMQIQVLDLSDTRVTAAGLLKHGLGAGFTLTVAPNQFTRAEFEQLEQVLTIEIRSETDEEEE